MTNQLYSRRLSRWMAGLLAAVVWVSPAMAAPRESMLGLRGHQGQAIVAGSDGAMWMVDTGQTFTVVRIPVGAGRWRSSPLPGPGGDASTPAVVGSDGSVWFGGGPFQSQTAASLVRTQRSGRVSVFPAGISGLGELVAGLVAGPGDDLWFTGFGDRSSLSRISVDGRVRVVVSSRDFKAFAAPLAYGADGAFWVNSGRRVTPGGRVTHVRTGGDTIVAGADGNLWLGGYGGLYRVTTSDQTTAFAWSPRPDGADPRGGAGAHTRAGREHLVCEVFRYPGRRCRRDDRPPGSHHAVPAASCQPGERDRRRSRWPVVDPPQRPDGAVHRATQAR